MATPCSPSRVIPREYVGGAIVSVTIADAPRIVLLLIGHTGPGPGGPLSLGGEFVIDEEVAATLSTTGWNFVYVPEDALNAPALSGQAMNARLDHMEMHADPNGLFFATLHMIETETGEARTVTATGRLTGGCAGADAPIPDPSAVALCEQVLGGL